MFSVQKYPQEVLATMALFDEMILLLKETGSISKNTSVKVSDFTENTWIAMDTFLKLRRTIEWIIKKDISLYVNTIQNKFTIRHWVYIKIVNLTWDILESGQFHIHKGVLNNLNWGEDLLKFHDMASDELVYMKSISKKDAENERSQLLKIIEQIW